MKLALLGAGGGSTSIKIVKYFTFFKEAIDSMELQSADWEHGLIGGEVGVNSCKIMCLFIKRGVIQRLIEKASPKSIQVLTRYNLDDFYTRVNDTTALRFLLESGAWRF